MKNESEMLVQKELELARVRKEIEALQIVVPLLRDREDWVRETPEPALTVAVIRQLLAQNAAGINSPHASSSWRVRWREAANRFFPGISIRRHSEARK